MRSMTDLPISHYRGGFRVSRGGQVYAVARIYHGRPSGAELFSGHVWKDGRRWRNDQTSTQYARQDDAARALYRIVVEPHLKERSA